MKKIGCVLAVLCLLATMFVTVAAADERVLTAADVAETIGDVVIEADSFVVAGQGRLSTVGFKNVDLTGVKSITIHAKRWAVNNGEIFRVKIDDPNALAIGEVIFNDGTPTARGNIEEQTGIHTLYLATTLRSTGGKWEITDVVLHKEAKEIGQPVPDSAIIDNWHDTWQATDDYGRKVADYEEVGDVKSGNHAIAMFYWFQSVRWNAITPKILEAHPEAFGDFKHPAWKNDGKTIGYWWGEPVLGFYQTEDYWLRRKHAILLANADVDAIFLDYTNDAATQINRYNLLLQAFHDARAAGINAPKVSEYGSMSGQTNGAPREVLPLMYYNQVKSGEYSDLIFRWRDGKPFYINFPISEKDRDVEDKDLLRLFDEIDKFDIVGTGERRGGVADPEFRWVNWVEEYPQHPFGIAPSGRREFLALGVAINQDYVDGSSVVGVFSSPYCKGRAYSEAFGEDYAPDNGRKAYFFREEASQVLNIDPEFVFVDGWNEWSTPNYSSYGAHTGTVFIDLFNEENSRDFEPSRSYLKDDYYNLLVDLARKYKGVRPAPVASAPITIDINGDAAQWDAVAPEFFNDNDNVNRDSEAGPDYETGEMFRYQVTINNSISRAKVARDNDNFYFYVKTLDAIKEGTPGWMNLYINVDRNPATGWAGFDYAVNLAGAGVVSKATGTGWTWETVGNAAYKVSGNVLQMSVPKALIGDADVADFEFKWSDGTLPDGDYLDFYSEGSVAPPAKFNYLYTEIAQTALSVGQRESLAGTTIVKAGKNKMIINGGKQLAYEADTRVIPFEMNGTVYIPATTYEEILGYGNAKVEYLAEDNTIYLGRFDLEEVDPNHHNIVNTEWTYTAVGSMEARNNGRYKTLTAPAAVADGIVYVPLTYVSDIFGWNYENLGDGVYVISRNAIDKTLVGDVLSHIQ